MNQMDIKKLLNWADQPESKAVKNIPFSLLRQAVNEFDQLQGFVSEATDLIVHAERKLQQDYNDF